MSKVHVTKLERLLARIAKAQKDAVFALSKFKKGKRFEPAIDNVDSALSQITSYVGTARRTIKKIEGGPVKNPADPKQIDDFFVKIKKKLKSIPGKGLAYAEKEGTNVLNSLMYLWDDLISIGLENFAKKEVGPVYQKVALAIALQQFNAKDRFPIFWKEAIKLLEGAHKTFKSKNGPKKPVKNPKKKKANIPHVLVELGSVNELKVQTNQECYTYTWSRNNAPRMCCNPQGDTLYLFRAKKSKNVKSGQKHEVQAACEKFQDWHDDPPQKANPYKINDNPQRRAGKAVHIVYDSPKWNKKDRYIHTFDIMPTVSMDNLEDPETVIISGSGLRIKPEGITG